MENDLKILKVEYLSNHFLNPNQNKIYKSLNWRRSTMEDDLKISKGKISTTTIWIVTYEFLGGI